MISILRGRNNKLSINSESKHMNNYSRRRFIRTSITGALGLSLLPLIKGCKHAVSDTIRLGFIGLGRQAVYLMQGMNKIPGVKTVAACDVYGIKRQRFDILVKENQAAKGETIDFTTYEDYHDLLARQDIDAVVIASPDHWHALMAIDACKAGKDIYLEKPLTFTIKEGIKLVEAVRQNNRILAVGSQQRSDPNFQHAIKMVREGKFGPITRINAWVGPGPSPYDLPEQEIPSDLNWDKWLGPNPYVHYHGNLNPPISVNPMVDEKLWGAWRWYKETGGGYITDWGAHNFDIAQWALDKNNSGPVKIIPPGSEGIEYVNFVYENGVVVANEPFSEDRTYGVKLWSEGAWIELIRGSYVASDPSLLPPAKEETADDVPYETASEHLQNFIDCIKSRKDPVVTVETGHRSCTLGNLANIAINLGRPIHWDPLNQRFVNDPQADKYFHREYREGYKV
jgi:predicted dehydrogenase